MIAGATVQRTMRAAAGAAAVLAWSCLPCGAGEAPSTVGPYAQNATLHAYTFNVHSALAMRTFPWLRFALDGAGRYERGHSYVVNFTRVPAFAAGFQRVDLSALDPAMWPAHYSISSGERSGDAMVFTLHEVRPSSLVRALVTVGDNDGVRLVVMQYEHGGEIRLNVTSQRIDGYLLPVATSGEIRMARMAIAEHTEFSGYAISAGARAAYAGSDGGDRRDGRSDGAR